MKQVAHVTFYRCSGRGTLYTSVSSIVGALQSTHALYSCSMLVPRLDCNQRGMCKTKFVVCQNYQRLRHFKR